MVQTVGRGDSMKQESKKQEMLGHQILLSVDQVTGINTLVTKQHIKGLQHTTYLYICEVQKTSKQF